MGNIYGQGKFIDYSYSVFCEIGKGFDKFVIDGSILENYGAILWHMLCYCVTLVHIVENGVRESSTVMQILIGCIQGHKPIILGLLILK